MLTHLSSTLRAAHRVSPEEARGLDHAELMDIRQFYCCANSSKCWDELSLYAAVLRGEQGADSQKAFSEALVMDTATRDGRTWYRLRQPIKYSDVRIDIVTSVWSSEAGFHPVFRSFAEQGEAGGAIRAIRQWSWRGVDGIFLPARVYEAWHPAEPGHVNTFLRMAELQDAILNAEIPQSQFSLAALGVADGDLLIDEIERTVSAVNQGGLVRIAGFNEPYTPPAATAEPPRPAAAEAPRRTVLIAANVGIVLCLLAIVWYRRRARRRPGTTDRAP